MSLVTDYATLVTTITDYLARSDLSTYVPNFLQNAQAKLYRGFRLRFMETALSGTTSSGVLALPSDYLELKYAYVNISPKIFLERTTPELIYTTYRQINASGKPASIAREGSNFIFGPLPDSDYAIAGIYYALPTLLSASNTSNWFITNAPDILIYSALLEAQPFLMNDKRIPVWQQLLGESIALVKRQDDRENHSGGSLATKLS